MHYITKTELSCKIGSREKRNTKKRVLENIVRQLVGSWQSTLYETGDVFEITTSGVIDQLL